MNIVNKSDNEDICIIANYSHNFNEKYFFFFVKRKTDVSIISDTSKIIEGSNKTNMLLCGGIKLHIENVLYSFKSYRNLLNLKDICLNGLHIETRDDEDIEYLCITK